ncbi:hypothetical protein DFH08DRAFT_801743 [Mycena albidolilacea]|uniref:Uncharacterized protein n=1 Tax=Mycena albidolilacea TaxID=1033008 RepID=A0AAD7F1A1_9AGAR|nr:hypothetical protein DFH08DRAFT_801743 [Mycena albidolilacea]
MFLLPLRLSCLIYHLTSSLSALKHDITGGAAVNVRIPSAIPSRRLKSVGAQSDVGSVVSLIFFTLSLDSELPLQPPAEMIPNLFTDYIASLGKEPDMKWLHFGAPVTLSVLWDMNSALRISPGLANNFQDVWNVIRFGELLAQKKMRTALWDGWMSSPVKRH